MSPFKVLTMITPVCPVYDEQYASDGEMMLTACPLEDGMTQSNLMASISTGLILET